MEIKYKKENSGHENSYEMGNNFQDFVCMELAKQNVILQNINSKKFQFETGENLQGFEIKLDNVCTGCGTPIKWKSGSARLSIETAEKSDRKNPYFVQSGIYRGDNSWLYIHGNYDMFWIFSVNMLRLLHKSGRYQEGHESTIQKFYIPITQADKFCAKKVVLVEKDYLYRKENAWMPEQWPEVKRRLKEEEEQKE